MIDELRRVALFGSGVAELTRARAEQMVKDLVKRGDLGSKDARGMVRELLDRSKENRRELVALLRSEVEDQISNLGLATRRDVERLERRVERAEDRLKALRMEVAEAKKAAPKEAPKKTAPKKTTARKTTSARARAAAAAAPASGPGPGPVEANPAPPPAPPS